MNRGAKIYIAGHTTLVGSGLYKSLLGAGYSNVLTPSRDELDLSNRESTEHFFNREEPQIVIIALTEESANSHGDKPGNGDLAHHLSRLSNLIQAAHRYQTNSLLMLATLSDITTQTEDTPAAPKLEEQTTDNEPEALFNALGMRLCNFYSSRFKRNFHAISATGVYGPNANLHTLRSNSVLELIQRFHSAKLSQQASIAIDQPCHQSIELVHIEDLTTQCLDIVTSANFQDGKRVQDLQIKAAPVDKISLVQLSGIIKTLVGFQGEITFPCDEGTARANSTCEPKESAQDCEKLVAKLSQLYSSYQRKVDAPSIIFYTMPCSGSSAIDPIISDLLRLNQDYSLTPYTTEGSHLLVDDVKSNAVLPPFYHWTHSPPATFAGIESHCKVKFITLRRDPRDAVVSVTHLKMKDRPSSFKVFSESLKAMIDTRIKGSTQNCLAWQELSPLNLSFEEIKSDMRNAVRRLLEHVEYDEQFINEEIISQVIKRHSYEAVTGRSRGAGGELIRTGYMYRKGVSGEWKQVFSQSDNLRLNEILPEENFLGYTKVDKLAQITSPPFACGSSWIANLLLELDIKTTYQPLAYEQWQESDSSLKINTGTSESLKNKLPILHRKSQFLFRDAVEVRWAKTLNFANNGPRPTILVLRAPSDAVFLTYQRKYSKHSTFEQYLTTNDHDESSLPGLQPLDNYAFYTVFWLAMSNSMPVNVISYEDGRSKPKEMIKDILGFLDINRTEQDIESAVSTALANDFDHEKTATEELESKSFDTKILAPYSGSISSLYDTSGKLKLGYVQSLMYDHHSFICSAFGEDIANSTSRVYDHVWHKSSAIEVVAPIFTERLEREKLLIMCGMLVSKSFCEQIFDSLESTQAEDAYCVFINFIAANLNRESIFRLALNQLQQLETQTGIALSHLL